MTSLEMTRSPGAGGPARLRPGRTRRPARCLSIHIASACVGLLVMTAGAARAAVVPWMSLEEMTGRAEVIVLGEVRSAEGAWSRDGRIIVTRVTLAVDRALKGGPRATVTFEVLGGKVDGQLMIASDAPVFRPGERVIVFLETAGRGAGAHLGVVGWNLGRMAVTRDPHSDRDVVLERTGAALYLDRNGKVVRPAPRPGGPIGLEELLAEIERLAGNGARP